MRASRARAPTACGLLTARCAQALGGAAGLAIVFELFGGAGPGRRLWLGAAVLATALGPALGGALTEAFDWRAIFVVGVPVAAAGASPSSRARARPRRRAGASRASPLRPALALALVSAALARCSSCSSCCSWPGGTSAR